MDEPKKRRTFAEWLRDTLIIYVLPIFIVGYVNYTKCWPYQAMKDFAKGSMLERRPGSQNEIIQFIAVIILAGIFYGFRYLYKKMVK